jgi:DNA ligase-1
MSAFRIQFQNGAVYLPALGLWLDAHEPQSGGDIVFVSHAHSDHTALHREIIVTEPTARLMHARLEGQWIEHVAPYGRVLNFPGKDAPYSIRLLPAGHIFGSAMSHIEAGGSSLLYTGDFKLRPGLSAEPCEPRNADILIMETTYGRPHYQFPPAPEVMKGIIRFCREALDNDETAVLLGYSLGKSQELLCGLGDAGLPIMLHGTVHKLTNIYEKFGICFPPYEKYDPGKAQGKVLLCPPNVANSSMLRNLGRTRVAVLTGWAVDPNCRFRYAAHAAFPLSDHADFPELVQLVQKVNPKKVYTLHGFAAEFAQSLRDLGFDAQPLSEEDQLALPLAIGPGARRFQTAPSANGLLRERAEPATGASIPGAAFHNFAEICAKIASTTKKLEKTRYLAEYFSTLESKGLGLVAVWFTGNPFPPSQNKVLQLGWALIRDVLCSIGSLSQAEFGQIYLKHSDLGEAAFEVLEKTNSGIPSTETLLSVDNLFGQLIGVRGPIAKLPLLLQVLQRCTPLEGKYLIKILTGDLRIGLKEGLVEEAIAKAFEVPLDQVKNANLLLGNTGETAVLAQHKQLPFVTLIPFRPVKYMLASPEETAVDIWKRVLDWHQPSLNPAETLPMPLPEPAVTVWVEDKYDGVRAQMHKVGRTVAIYSRDLKEITRTFMELADAIRDLPQDFILDGEIVAMRGEAVLPFAELQRRLGRREGDLFLGEQIPVQFVAFDLLWQDGKNLLDTPLRERRAALESLPSNFRGAQITKAGSEQEIEAAFTAARARNNEGLIIKDPQSVYTPGRRGLAWLKLKKAYATLDCVVVGAEYGHGKRRSVLSDYTFAVRDDSTGELKTIGKAYTGLTDNEIAHLTKHFLRRVVWQRGRYHAVEPDTVLEIAFDLLQPSERHSSGLAMRFPRIVRIRSDKAVAEIDTLATARHIAEAKGISKVK